MNFPSESKSGESSGAEGPSSVRSSEDGSEGSGAVGGSSSSYKERGEFYNIGVGSLYVSVSWLACSQLYRLVGCFGR